ncbi:DUF2007 domain-containing protein [Pararhizobium sp. IMCC21322]|uniref:putative signal transducing protein n=1 Tax=Pararhizobium sp. IMCC21322 TaxID=3067903 RepID=UPI0027424A3C|nr:DUF2007 domain-containing protein [Pararhizobium sp. IMCC21322]
MKEILRTNDMVLISFVETLLTEARIKYLVLDQNMSVMDGSIGVLPRRLLVAEEQEAAARKLFEEAEIAHELRSA